jgi:hypothetical protein
MVDPHNTCPWSLNLPQLMFLTINELPTKITEKKFNEANLVPVVELRLLNSGFLPSRNHVSIELPKKSRLHGVVIKGVGGYPVPEYLFIYNRIYLF